MQMPSQYGCDVDIPVTIIYNKLGDANIIWLYENALEKV